MYCCPREKIYFLVICLVAISLTSCSIVRNALRPEASPIEDSSSSSPSESVPKREPKSRYGNPKSYEVFGKRYYVLESSEDFIERGIASWYGHKFHGKRTSSGETYDMHAMTAAHKNLPLPTYVEVTNLDNQKKVLVRVNDRGPFHGNRIIDLSHAAAQKLDIVGAGTALVEVRAVEPGNDANVSPDTTRSTQVERSAKFNRSDPDDLGFYIQTGAFIELLNAENMIKKLQVVDADMAKVSEFLDNGITFYRVRIGPLKSIDVADLITDRLEELQIFDYRMVAY